MSLESLHTPVGFLQSNLSGVRVPDWLQQFHGWWETEGQGISDAVDRAGTPSLRMFDVSGTRVDEILYPPEYWRMLRRGYQSGLLWRVFEENAVFSAGLGIYLTSFYDPGLACPYTVSFEYGGPALQIRQHRPSGALFAEIVMQG